jgi:acetoin utilization deacetylase AcuC-like enzyme
MTTVYYSEKYISEGFGVDTREKARDIAHSLTSRPIEGITLAEPEAATVQHYQLAHGPRYAQALMTGRPEAAADQNGLGIWTRDLATSVAFSTGGVIAAVREAWNLKRHTGSLSSGLHHAKKNFGAGFCTINALVVAARLAVQEGASRILIVDFDAHCGGGTASLLTNNDPIEQIDVSVSSYDSYTPSDTIKLWMADGATYLDSINTALSSVMDPSSIDVVIYNAGMDPHERCSTGGEKGITTQVLRQREQMVFSWANTHAIPVAFVLAGGYSGRNLTRGELVDLHRLTLEAAASLTHPFVTL